MAAPTLLFVTNTFPSEKRQTLEFNLEAANVNSNICFMISGSAIFPELVTVTLSASGHPIFLHADTPDPTALIYPLKHLMRKLSWF